MNEGDVLADFRDNCRRLFVKPTDDQGKRLHAAVGISSEAGELLNAIKREWIYEDQIDIENVLEECGDLLFYIDRILDPFGFTLCDAMVANMRKLWKRYPDGYSDRNAIERKDKQ